MSAPEREDAAPAGIRGASVVRWVLVLVMAGVAIASVLYVYGGSGRLAPSTGVAAAPGAVEPTRYHCPMHPQIVRDRPGECPICQMTLVPIETARAGHDAGEPGTAALPSLAPVQLSPERIQLAGIKTAPVARRRLGDELVASGVVAENERGLAAINIRFAGWIQDLFVAETGRRVTKGQALATIYSPDVLSAEQEFLTARRWSSAPAGGGSETGAPPHAHESLTAGMADDARKRLDLLGVAPQEIDEIARTGQARHAVTIRSPVNGTVIRRGAVAGGYVQPGSELFAIADLSTVWFVAEVYEHDMARVRVGQSARIELTGLPGHAVKGRVQFLYPSVSADTRTMRVRVEVANRGGELRPGMFGSMHLDVPGAMGLAVPTDAVVDTGDVQYLFVAKGSGRFEPRRVKLGARGAGFVEILDGVADGEAVVTTANFLVDSESRLRAAIEGAR